MINFAVPSTEFLDRRFDVFVVTDLDALVEISVLKKREWKKKLIDAPQSNIMSRFIIQAQGRTNRKHNNIRTRSKGNWLQVSAAKHLRPKSVN